MTKRTNESFLLFSRTHMVDSGEKTRKRRSREAQYKILKVNKNRIELKIVNLKLTETEEEH